jgi:hypothetical protein
MISTTRTMQLRKTFNGDAKPHTAWLRQPPLNSLALTSLHLQRHIHVHHQGPTYLKCLVPKFSSYRMPASGRMILAKGSRGYLGRRKSFRHHDRDTKGTLLVRVTYQNSELPIHQIPQMMKNDAGSMWPSYVPCSGTCASCCAMFFPCSVIVMPSILQVSIVAGLHEINPAISSNCCHQWSQFQFLTRK